MRNYLVPNQTLVRVNGENTHKPCKMGIFPQNLAKNGQNLNFHLENPAINPQKLSIFKVQYLVI